MSAEDARKLSSIPLEDISSQLLAEFTNSAYGGAESEYKYFLPRYLDLIAQCDPPENIGIETCLSVLGVSDYRNNWPTAEVELIDEFFDAFLEASLNQIGLSKWSGGWELIFEIGDILCMMVIGGGDIERLLDTFENADDPAAAIHMVNMRKHVTFKREKARFDNAHFSDFPTQSNKIAEWLGRESVTGRIIAAIDLINNPDYDDIFELSI